MDILILHERRKDLTVQFLNSILMNGYCASMGSIMLYFTVLKSNVHCFHIITLYSNNLCDMCHCHPLQYSELAAEVHKGRGRIPVADYKIVKSIGEGDVKNDIGQVDQNRTCYSFCMCPGGQVSHFLVV